LPGGDRREHVPVEVDYAPLECRLGEALAHGLDEAKTLVGGHESYSLQPPRLQVAEEGQPTRRVLLAPLHHPQHLAVPVGVDAHRHQYGYVLDLAAPGPLQPDAVQEDVGVVAGDGPVTPLLDAGVDLLVQLADGARRDLRAPQGLRYVLHTAHGHAG